MGWAELMEDLKTLRALVAYYVQETSRANEAISLDVERFKGDRDKLVEGLRRLEDGFRRVWEKRLEFKCLGDVGQLAYEELLEAAVMLTMAEGLMLISREPVHKVALVLRIEGLDSLRESLRTVEHSAAYAAASFLAHYYFSRIVAGAFKLTRDSFEAGSPKAVEEFKEHLLKATPLALSSDARDWADAIARCTGDQTASVAIVQLAELMYQLKISQTLRLLRSF